VRVEDNSDLRAERDAPRAPAGQFGMGEPPYDGAAATECNSTADTTSCTAPGAHCWSLHPSVADACSNYAAPVCDCDDTPCRCWAPPRSRFE
jgi:hypothetical protein